MEGARRIAQVKQLPFNNSMESTEPATSATHPGYVMVPKKLVEDLLAAIDLSPQAPPMPLNLDDFLEEFEQACKIDYRLKPRTIVEHLRHVRKLLDYLGKHPLQATRPELRRFLMIDTAKNAAKAIRVLYGKFLGSDLASCFKVPQTGFKPKVIPPKETLVKTYRKLGKLERGTEYRAVFLILATSGLRRGELVGLTLENIDFELRMIRPSGSTVTKRRWVTFYNEEAERALKKLLKNQDLTPESRIFRRNADTYTKRITECSQGELTPQILRDWFAEEMGRLGVSDRYIDAFCGRIPRTILARHYTDYAPEKLKEFYDRAGLRVLKQRR